MAIDEGRLADANRKLRGACHVLLRSRRRQEDWLRRRPPAERFEALLEARDRWEAELAADLAPFLSADDAREVAATWVMRRLMVLFEREDRGSGRHAGPALE